ncbi:MAG: nicotinate-nucleotide adenylyltransferase [Candidatus Acidulodesulfobacterium sp.]
MKIGIFGGTFNPIHYGHLRAAEEIAEKFLDEVIFVPTNITSNKSIDAEAEAHPQKRLEMIRIAIKDEQKFKTSDIEIKRGGFSYSYDTIVEFKKKYKNDDLYFIVGADAFAGLKNWKNAETILKTIDFIVAGRPKYGFKNLVKLIDFLPDNLKKNAEADLKEGKIVIDGKRAVYFFNTTKLDISSTVIRNNFKNNISNLFLLPNGIINYIINNKLYE